MKNAIYIVAIWAVIFLPLTSFSQDLTPIIDEQLSPIKRFGLAKGGVTTRYRHQNFSGGSDRIQARVSLDGYINLTPNGCLKLKARIATGDKLSSRWSTLEVLDGDGDFEVNLRNIYLDYSCYKTQIQLGALTPELKGVYGMDADGWIDGIRAIHNTDLKYINRIVITAGNVDEFYEPSALKRDLDKFNFFQVIIEGDLSENFDYTAEISEFDNIPYAYLILNYALQDAIEFIQSITVEEYLADGGHQGYALRFNLSPYQGYQVGIGYTSLDPFKFNEDLDESVEERIVDDFYGKGDNYHIKVTKPINEKWQSQVLFRDGEAKKRLELRLTRKF